MPWVGFRNATYSSNMLAIVKLKTTFLSSKTTFLSLLILLRYCTIWVRKDFFTLKRFKPRPSFFSMSKYRNSRPDSKNFKFFSPQVFQIFDSKHGSPENYSDFFFSFSFSSSRSRAMRSPRHNFSKILSNWNEILQTCSGVNEVVPNIFWVHSVQGFWS